MSRLVVHRAALFDEGVETVEESVVAVGFVDPASLWASVSEGLGVDALGGEHGDRGGVGAEAGAVFADVGVGAGALGGGAEAVAAGEA